MKLKIANEKNGAPIIDQSFFRKHDTKNLLFEKKELSYTDKFNTKLSILRNLLRRKVINKIDPKICRKEFTEI